MYYHDCYKVTFSDGTEIIADKDHRWTVDNIKQGITETINTDKMYRLHRFRKSTRCRYAVPTTKPLIGKKKNLYIDPYLLGIWLGDGNSYSAQLTCHVSDAKEYGKILTKKNISHTCLLYTSPSPRDGLLSRMPSSA